VTLLPISERGYTRPEVLVSTGWVAEHLDDTAVRLLESDEDVLLYDSGHLPGAQKLDWVDDLNDPLQRDYIERDAMERLLRSKGINPDTSIVLYGDRNNWWATYAFWVLRLFGVERLALMDGGRQRWIDIADPQECDVARAHSARHVGSNLHEQVDAFARIAIAASDDDASRERPAQLRADLGAQSLSLRPVGIEGDALRRDQQP